MASVDSIADQGGPQGPLLSEFAREKIDKVHDRLNVRILGRNWQVFEKGMHLEQSHRRWVMREWVARWIRYVWINRAKLCIHYRSRTGDMTLEKARPPTTSTRQRRNNSVRHSSVFSPLSGGLTSS
eukprot:CAMPEP_0114153000 /NCGR_PEP_ID=MMETSP0043_2-20121206/24115_1 /TAXON_ID=464988 /ORGANISM="Hemiselmis andersenii, Strain CCMP644" /LENGTH=125 /DNA_ID=CAMNT_0001247993 /DNA_START=15 /DNA_END=388 /DNA_ORIENTATION=+